MKEINQDKINKSMLKIYGCRNENISNIKTTHDINLTVTCRFKGINGGVIFETKENQINCNSYDLEVWFKNLKKVVRMLDESISDKEVGRGG